MNAHLDLDQRLCGLDGSREWNDAQQGGYPANEHEAVHGARLAQCLVRLLVDANGRPVWRPDGALRAVTVARVAQVQGYVEGNGTRAP